MTGKRPRRHCAVSRLLPLRIRHWWILLSAASLWYLLVEASEEYDREIVDCGIYFAPSSIPGAGFGMFAGKDFAEHEILTPGDLVVPVMDFHFHNNYDLHFVDSKREKIFLWDEYMWDFTMAPEAELDVLFPKDDLNFASSGMGAAVNGHMGLHNAYDKHELVMDNAGLEAQSSPGVGAFTPYHGRVFMASRSIPAGAELFADYGEGYFKSREKVYGVLPGESDFEEADKLLRKFQKLARNETLGFSSDLLEDMWSLVSMTKRLLPSSSVLSALPERVEDISGLLSTGGTQYRDLNRSIYSIEYLSEYGLCMDHLAANTSTIPDAGRGAFARRSLRKGSVVAVLPLIHVEDADMLTMYDVVRRSDDYEPNLTKPIHTQLLINYCMSHPESTLLLCPYGLVTWAINHGSLLSGQANVQLRWSPKTTRHPQWMNLSIDEWADTKHAGLSMEVVALRDIEEGEEVLMDYGPEWQAAWDEHVERYTRKPPRPNYLPSFELNLRMDIEMRVDGVGRPYELDFVSLECVGEYVSLSIPRLTEDTPCRVLARNPDGTYLAQVVDRAIDGDYCWVDRRGGHGKLIFSIPRNGFWFLDHHLARDHVQPWSFRHPMMIPDDMFPGVWKNKPRNPPGKSDNGGFPRSIWSLFRQIS